MAIAAMVFLTLALSGVVKFSPADAMKFILGLTGLGVGGHALTDIAGVIGKAIAEHQTTHIMPVQVQPNGTIDPSPPGSTPLDPLWKRGR